MSKNAGSPGPDQTIAEDVRMRRAALTRDRVDPLDVLGAEVVERLRDDPDGLVLTDARTQESVELLVCGIHHRRRLREQPDLVAGLDAARLHEQLLAVDDADALLLQREQDRKLDHVDAERLIRDAELLELALDLLRDAFGDFGIRSERAAEGGDPRSRAALRAAGAEHSRAGRSDRHPFLPS